LLRFEFFLRTATRFFAFAMAISCGIMLPARHLNTTGATLPYLETIRHSLGQSDGSGCR